jgi:hypothetical protein
MTHAMPHSLRRRDSLQTAHVRKLAACEVQERFRLGLGRGWGGRRGLGLGVGVGIGVWGCAGVGGGRGSRGGRGCLEGVGELAVCKCCVETLDGDVGCCAVGEVCWSGGD